MRRNSLGKLPFIATQFGKWWGNNPIAREQADIDVIAAEPQGKNILFGECKWRNTFNETEAIERLHRRADLVRGYPVENARFMLFTKLPVSEVTRKRYQEDDSMTFISASNLYTVE